VEGWGTRAERESARRTHGKETLTREEVKVTLTSNQVDLVHSGEERKSNDERGEKRGGDSREGPLSEGSRKVGKKALDD